MAAISKASFVELVLVAEWVCYVTANLQYVQVCKVYVTLQFLVVRSKDN